MTHRGPFQLLPFCDSVILGLVTAWLLREELQGSAARGRGFLTPPTAPAEQQHSSCSFCLSPLGFQCGTVKRRQKMGLASSNRAVESSCEKQTKPSLRRLPHPSLSVPLSPV